MPTAPSLAQKRLLLRSLLALRLPPVLQIPKGPSLRKEHYSRLEPSLRSRCSKKKPRPMGGAPRWSRLPLQKGDGLPGSIPHRSSTCNSAKRRSPAQQREPGFTCRDEATTEAGRDAFGYYHGKKDEQRDVGLGPSHDWSSHAADAFGLMAIAYEEPSRVANFNRKIVLPYLGKF